MRSTAAAPRTTMSHRRDVISHSDALRAEPAFHLATNRSEALGRLRLVARDDDRLRVRCADETPPVAEQDANTVDVDHVVPLAEVFDRFLDEPELQLLLYVDAKLGRRDKRRHVGKRLRDSTPRVGENAEKARRAVHRVVVSVKALAEEHVAGHLAGDGRVHLAHLVLDERVAGLPHHGLSARLLYSHRQRLRALHIEDDRLTTSGALENVARVEDEDPVSPHDLAVAVDHADAVRVAVEGDPDLRTIGANGRDE